MRPRDRLLIALFIGVALTLVLTADPTSYGGAWLSGRCWHSWAPAVCHASGRMSTFHMPRWWHLGF
jgi:hypothetical protein